MPSHPEKRNWFLHGKVVGVKWKFLLESYLWQNKVFWLFSHKNLEVAFFTFITIFSFSGTYSLIENLGAKIARAAIKD